MFDIQFGLPKKEKAAKAVKQEKYPEDSVLTMNAKPAEGGRTFRFAFNKKANSTIGLNLDGADLVTFGFIRNKEDNLDKIFIGINIGTHNNTCKVTKKGEFCSRPIHDYIADQLSISQELNHEFKLQEIDNQGQILWQLDRIKTEEEEIVEEGNDVQPQEPTVNQQVGTLVE